MSTIDEMTEKAAKVMRSRASNGVCYADGTTEEQMYLADAAAARDAMGVPALLAERDELRAIVAKLPITKDGKPIVPGMTVYHCCGHAIETGGHRPACNLGDTDKCFHDGKYKTPDGKWSLSNPRKFIQWSDCYSTQEAAATALAATAPAAEGEK